MSGCGLSAGFGIFIDPVAPGGHWDGTRRLGFGPGYLAVYQLCVDCAWAVRVMMFGVATRTMRSRHAGHKESGIV